ncbi:MAG: outer membrane beta-barrel family protein [Ferruginibacter sp.]
MFNRSHMIAVVMGLRLTSCINILFFLLTFPDVTAIAQNNTSLISIMGTIMDSTTRKPLGLTTVILKSVHTSKIIKSILTNDEGGFNFNTLSNQPYEITITRIGYQKMILTVIGTSGMADSSFDLHEIQLSPESRQLKDVIVVAARPLIKRDVDRLSYNVQADPDNKIQSVLELMSKVPLLSVDADDNILLKGSGNYKIFINGRPSSQVSRNPREALRAMPASSILRIEVITTPPAKYDAEGLAGIINIVMNKKLEDGYNASIGVNYNNVIGMSENASFTGKKGKFGITGRAYDYKDFKRYLERKKTWQSFIPVTSLLTQQGIYSYAGIYNSENLELSYEFDSLNLVSASVGFFKSKYDDQTIQAAELLNDQNRLVQSYNLRDINPQNESGLDIDLNYQLGFKHHKNELLTFSYLRHNFPNSQSNEVLIDHQYDYPQNSYLQVNNNGTREQTIQLDYIHPAKRFTIDGGAKAIMRRNFSDFTGEIFDPIASRYIPDEKQNNQFNYNQNVYSLYNSWQLKFKPVDFKAGLRLEHTIVDADFRSEKSTIHENYTNLIPVISVQHTFSGSAVTLGYTQRISRPGIYQLNPFIARPNPQFISSGNPRLRAVLNNNFEVAYSAFGKGNYSIALSYSFANNSIQQVTTLVDTVSYTTYLNIGENKTAGLNASINYPFSKAISVNFNSALTYLWIKGTYSGRFYTNNGLQGYANTSLSYKINANWKAMASLTYVSANIMLQGRTNAYIFNTYRLSKQLFNKKLLLSASVSNPYSRYRYARTETVTTDFRQLVSSQRNYRMFALNVNYNFGALKSAIRKNQRSIKNDDLSGKSTSGK